MPILQRKTEDRKTLNFRRIHDQLVDASELVEIMKTRENDISEVRYVRPRIGSRSFGKFRVKWKNNRYGV